MHTTFLGYQTLQVKSANNDANARTSFTTSNKTHNVYLEETMTSGEHAIGTGSGNFEASFVWQIILKICKLFI